MTSDEIRKRFIDYFVKNGHVQVPSSSLVPERHPTLLFTNSGMVQFTSHFLGEKDPVCDFGSRRLCSIQKCIRTGDLNVVGKSKYHLTFFEMMGSWSIGDYGKQKGVEFAYDLLTNKKYGFGLDANKFYPTVFYGSEEASCDDETIEAWKSVSISEDRILKLPASENWWAPAGLNGPGPCGPCTEILYDRGERFGPKEETPGLSDNPRYIEIWNAGVFMQYNRDDSGKLHPLERMSVDTGAGLERFAVLLQGVDSVYETDLFLPIIEKIKSMAAKFDNNPDAVFALRRSADHLRASTFIISENVYPSNKDQGYVLRRLIRTVFNDFVWKMKIDVSRIVEIVPTIINKYKDVYPEIDKIEQIQGVLIEEYVSYKKLADNTKRFIEKNYLNKNILVIDNPFDIFQSIGAPVELILDVVSEMPIKDINWDGFDKKFQEHQKLSRQGAGQKFKGGLGDHSAETTRLHTATHLLHAALREILGDHIQQMGSNITAERLRFDFSHPQKVSAEELKKIENIVNQKIKEGLPVNRIILPREKAEETGALHFFKEKYGDEVSIYYIGNDIESALSKEYCGGPHVLNTLEIKSFRILKEEAVGKGIRRIKATF